MDKDKEVKNLKNFQNSKNETLNKDDLSRKGSIDEPIRNLVDIINQNTYYYTTSTCSGRITLIEKPYGLSGQKKGSKFHLNSHILVDYNNIKSVIDKFLLESKIDERDDNKNCLWLKFEPFIMHIQCYDIDKARHLLNIALTNGCRNSGVTFGKLNKFMIAVRSTSSMEVPIACDKRFEINDNYLRYLCEEINRRLAENMEKLAKLQSAIDKEL